MVAGEMSWCIKRLPCNPEDLSVKTLSHFKPGMAAHRCDLNVSVERWEARQGFPWMLREHLI